MLPQPPAELGGGLEDLVQAGYLLVTAVEARVPHDLLADLASDIWVLAEALRLLHETGSPGRIEVGGTDQKRAQLLRMMVGAEGVEVDRRDVAYVLRAIERSPDRVDLPPFGPIL